MPTHINIYFLKRAQTDDWKKKKTNEVINSIYWAQCFKNRIGGKTGFASGS